MAAKKVSGEVHFSIWLFLLIISPVVGVSGKVVHKTFGTTSHNQRSLRPQRFTRSWQLDSYSILLGYANLSLLSSKDCHYLVRNYADFIRKTMSAGCVG